MEAEEGSYKTPSSLGVDAPHVHCAVLSPSSEYIAAII